MIGRSPPNIRASLRAGNGDFNTFTRSSSLGSPGAAAARSDPYNSNMHSHSLRESMGNGIGSPARAAKERHGSISTGNTLRASQSDPLRR